MKRSALTIVLATAAALQAQDIPWARDLYIHGLKDRAMESFIAILHTPSTAGDKAEALYYIGQISFEQGSFATAMNDWEKLVSDYPKSPRALELKDRFTQLREVYSKLADPPLDSVVARSYIKNEIPAVARPRRLVVRPRHRRIPRHHGLGRRHAAEGFPLAIFRRRGLAP
jgi:tetratricopeptide (TPR) repeat protein